VVLIGGFLVDLARVMNSMVSSLAGPYMAAIIGGLGAGAD
jgi:hypothetical protein